MSRFQTRAPTAALPASAVEGDTRAVRQGMFAALAAFVTWGLAPLYFRALGSVPPFEIVAHRVLWSALLLALMLATLRFTGGFERVGAVLRQPRLLALLALTSLLTSSNWLVFIWAIDAGRLLEASLGYFINPLVSVALGAIFLGERLRPLQAAAVGIACAGVAWRVWQLGSLPWIPLFLAGTFGLYGLLRKRAPVDAVGGLFIETLVVAPLALAWLLWLHAQGSLAFGSGNPAEWRAWALACAGVGDAFVHPVTQPPDPPGRPDFTIEKQGCVSVIVVRPPPAGVTCIAPSVSP